MFKQVNIKQKLKLGYCFVFVLLVLVLLGVTLDSKDHSQQTNVPHSAEQQNTAAPDANSANSLPSS